MALYELDLPFQTRLVTDEASRRELSDHAAALQARFWDRFHDQYVAAPMQKIVGDTLRPDGGHDPEGVREAQRTLQTAYTILELQLASSGSWTAGPTFTIADCAVAPALFYARVVQRWNEQEQCNITRYYRDLVHRPSVARVIEEARPYRELLPLPWPRRRRRTSAIRSAPFAPLKGHRNRTAAAWRLLCHATSPGAGGP